MKNKVIIFIIIIILFSSCSFINNSEKKDDIIEHPDIILNSATYKINRNQNDYILLNSSKIEIYNKKNTTIAKDAIFKFVNKNGENEVEGKCDEMSINTDNNNVLFTGNVTFSILDPEFNIYCEKLSWDDKNQLLTTQDQDVTVESEIGKFEGSGLSAKINIRYFEFNQIKKGELY